MSKPSVTRKLVTTSPEVLASETLFAVLSSETVQQAADMLGISRKQVHKRIQMYQLKDKIAQIKENAVTELTMGTGKAARKLVGLIDSDDEKVAKSAADSVLDRAGVTKSDTTPVNTIIFNRGDVVKSKYVKD